MMFKLLVCFMSPCWALIDTPGKSKCKETQLHWIHIERKKKKPTAVELTIKNYKAS